MARCLAGRPAGYKLGRTLAQEVAACLLGGHGIPAPVGLAAYKRLHERGAFGPPLPSQAMIEEWDVRASELDAVIWCEMASSPKAARAVIGQLESPSTDSVRWRSPGAARQRELSLV
ncbi:hypothetical protein [Verminephrobacter eiseniae]|uniref:hypothetical protein n=1 Tax=Verminephrobacter eiseniae TaxID=364317 RepID=UPI0018DC6B22|nr:hypothetical protein [Verminephrobacter eiseniae]